MGKYFYAVRIGNAPGVYNTWSECEREVKGFKGAVYKKFKTYEDAAEFAQLKIENKSIQRKEKDIDINNTEEMLLGKIKQEEQKYNEETDKYNCRQEDIVEGEAVSYVDGSFCLQSMTYSYGVVIITKEKIETYNGKENNPDLAQMRNVSGELKGAMVAMGIAIDKGYKKLSIYYDYLGIEKWAIGEWKTNKTGTKSYKQYYDSIKNKLEVNFIKVPAHTGVKYNELADQLAKEAIEK